MIIENNDYILEQLSDNSIFWDLTFPKVIHKGKDNERIEFKDPIYGITLDSAKKRIALFRVNNKLGDSKKTSPEKFNVLYTEEKNIINKELINL